MAEHHKRLRVAFATLGCKANQYESGRLAEQFAARDCEVVPVGSPTDVLIVNTCTVTNVAEAKSRARLRRLRREHPAAFLVATGCSAEINPESMGPLSDLLVPNTGKANLVDFTLAHRGLALPIMNEDAVPANAQSARLTSLGRTRSLLMIQDGCEDRCTYCIIPSARPVVSSRPADDVLREASALTGKGYKEIVLTGISIGSWRDGNRRLPSLLKALARIAGIERIRLSSIEPRTVSDSLLKVFADEPALCRHLHIPLQSGDDGVLADMERTYNTQAYRTLIHNVRKRLPDAGIATDVIVGFPTETNDSFERTLRFCEEMDFCKIHVFPFSPRVGTPASAIRDIVGSKTRKERTARLIEISDSGVRRWAENAVNSTVVVIAEPKDSKGRHSGLTSNGVRVMWPSRKDVTGDLVTVRITGAEHGTAFGEAVP